MSKVKKKKAWETMWNIESNDSTWELVNNKEDFDIRLLFFNYDNQASPKEVLKEQITLKLTENQLNSLLKFCKTLNRKVKE